MKEYYEGEYQEYFGYIYLIIDQKNNLKYIGRKKGKVEKSKYYFGSGVKILEIKKERSTKFLKKIILGLCDTFKELKYCEDEVIDFYQTSNYLYGYNKRKKGSGEGTLNDECKISISIKNKENYKNKENFGMKGKHHSEETKEKIRVSKLGSFEKIHGIEKAKKIKEKISKSLTGKKLSQETKKRKSLAMLKVWEEKKIFAKGEGIGISK